MNHIDSAADLFREIKRRGLELRRGEGRDDVLYHQLASKLGLEPDRIQKGLDQGRVSVEEFVYAFFSILQPFAQMYSDIYAEMQRQGAKRATESVRIQFDFSKAGEEPLEFDLEHFREVEMLVRRVKAYGTMRLWAFDDLHKLFEFQNTLSANLPYASDYKRYDPGRPYQLPSIPSASEPLRRALLTIRDIYQQIIDLAAEQEAAKETPDAIIQALQRERQDDQAEDQTITRLSWLLTDLLPGFVNIVTQLRDPRTEQRIGSYAIARAVDYFEDEVIAHLHQRKGLYDSLVQDLLDFLNLPMWKHRWYLYEIWSSMQVVAALREYDAQLILRDSALNVEAGRATRIAEFDTAAGVHLDLWVQKQTTLSGVPGRKVIMPDLRLCLPDGNQPEDTIVLVEFKQRKSMGRVETVFLVNIYDAGTPRSLGNFYLNYDAFPTGVEVEIANPRKSFLFEFLNPQYPDNVSAFQEQLVEVLRAGGYEPLGGWFDVLLLDVSGSMNRRYSDPEVIRDLRNVVHLHPDIRVYFFDTRLIDPGDREAISSSESIGRYLGGGTQMENALQDLLGKVPDARRLLVVTDGEYGFAPSLARYEEVMECLPADLHTVISNLRQ